MPPPHLPVPLLVLDTNVIVDMWLGRDSDQAILLLKLVEEDKIDLCVPEIVLLEFRGTALRLVDEEERKLEAVRKAANDWRRSSRLDTGADRGGIFV